MEFLLFSDMLIYAKPVKHQKTDKIRFIVYKQAHRSLIEVSDYPDISSKSEKGQNLMELVLYGSEDVLHLHLRAPSATEKTRWLEAFNPPREREDYAAWDCPQARVIRDYDKKEPDELTLRVGDLVNIISRGAEGICKGRLTGSSGPDSSGWFPICHVREVESMHQHARVIKATHLLKSPSASRLSDCPVIPADRLDLTAHYSLLVAHHPTVLQPPKSLSTYTVTRAVTAYIGEAGHQMMLDNAVLHVPTGSARNADIVGLEVVQCDVLVESLRKKGLTIVSKILAMGPVDRYSFRSGVVVVLPHQSGGTRDIVLMVTHSRPGGRPAWIPVEPLEVSIKSITARLPFLGMVAVCHRLGEAGKSLLQPPKLTVTPATPTTPGMDSNRLPPPDNLLTFETVNALDAHGAIVLSFHQGFAAAGPSNIKARVVRIQQALSERGYNVWFDNDRHITQGHLDQRTVDVIQNCALLLACLSPEYDLENTDSRKELEYALFVRRPVVGVQVVSERSPGSGLFGRYFGDMLCIDLSNDNSFAERINQLCSSLGNLARRLDSKV